MALFAIQELTCMLPQTGSNELGGGEMRPEEIKAGQRGASPKICPVGGGVGVGISGGGRGIRRI